MSDFIPVNEPALSNDSKLFVNEAMDSGWLSSSGKYVQEFENKFSSYLGLKYGIAVSNGTAALHVALLSLGIGPGDEVIVPAFTMAATWLAVIYIGAKPVFVDCEDQTFNLDINKIEEKITKKTKAILPVHIYGHSVDMEKIMEIAKKYNLKVIEDAAEAHGAEFKHKKCGSFGDVNCFSFYANKIITTGEGGMVVTNDEEISKKAKKFRDLYHSDNRRFIHEKVGFNYRMTNLQAAIGCGELMHIEEYISKKEHMASIYSSLLKDIPGITLPVTKDYAKNVYWMYAILIDKNIFGIEKNKLREEMLKEGVDTRDFFYSPSDQPILKKYLCKKDIFPVTDKISNNGFYVPSGLAITDEQMKKVAVVIKNIYLKNKKN